MSEEAAPVASPVALPISEPQAPAQSMSHSQQSRTEESERPAERQPPRELPPEPCKVPLHIPMSNSMLESLPMTHISTTLAGGICVCNHCASHCSFDFFGTTSLDNFLISAFFSRQKYPLRRPPSSYRSKSPWRFLWRWTIHCLSLQVCWHLLAGPLLCPTTQMKTRDWNTLSG